MALAQRIETLKKRHSEIDLKISSLQAHPSFDEQKIHELKRLKLNLKDELNQLLKKFTKAA